MSDDEFYLDGDGEVAVAPAPASTPKRHATNEVPFYFDLETTVDHDRLEDFELDPIPPVPECDDIATLPAIEKLLAAPVDSIKASLASFCCPPEYLDQLVLAEKNNPKSPRKGVFELIDKARLVREEAIQAQADRIKLLSTTPEYCAIAAIGVALGNDDVQSFVVGEPLPGGEKGEVISEEAIISAFWDNVVRCSPVVGFNCLYFDLPVLLVRSVILGIPASKRFNLSPWADDVCDVYIRRFGPRGNTGKDRPGKMKELAKLYQIDIPVEDCDGSQVHSLMQSKEGMKKVGEYVKSDVVVLRELHRTLAGYFWT